MNTAVTNNVRKKIIKYIVLNAQKHNLRHGCIHLAISLCERYIELEKIILKEYKKYSVMFVYIATKFEEIYPPGLEELSSVVGEKNIIEHLLDIEYKIIHKLNYLIPQKTVYHYLNKIRMVEKLSDDIYFLSLYLSTIVYMTNYHKCLSVEKWASIIVSFSKIIYDEQKKDPELRKEIKKNIYFLFLHSAWNNVYNKKLHILNVYFSTVEYMCVSSKRPPKINMGYSQIDISLDMQNSIAQKENKILIYSNEQIANAQILSLLGEGTFGVVKHAILNNQNVALKETKNNHNNNEGIEFIILREIAALCLLNHPNIIKIIGFHYDQKKNNSNLAMELMDFSLETSVEKKNLNEKQKMDYVLQLLLGLEYMHTNFIMHRDITPKNILTSSSGVLKISDMGSVRFLYMEGNDKDTYTKEVCAIFCRPIELLLGCKNYNLSFDIWSVACVIGYILGDGKYIFSKTKEKEMINYIFSILGTPTAEYNFPVCKWPYFPHNPTVFDRKGLVSLSEKYPLHVDILHKMLEYIPEKRIDATIAYTLFKNIENATHSLQN